MQIFRSFRVFQSTHPYGCDLRPRRWHDPSAVSIHAPIRVRRQSAFPFQGVHGFNPRTHTGATALITFITVSPLFQSTHPYGCDVPILSVCDISLGFQSTHPYGCDLNDRLVTRCEKCFNPRTHTGATTILPVSNQDVLFQSTHPYGCDPHPVIPIIWRDVSIHAPIRVRHHQRAGKGHHTPVSIHAPIRVRRGGAFDGLPVQSFNPRTHTGATRLPVRDDVPVVFQSTHPYGCDLSGIVSRRTQLVSIHAPIRVRLRK